MLLNMLKAIDAMLDGKPSDDTIKCAKKVLGEVIAHLEAKAEPKLEIKDYTQFAQIDIDLDQEALQAQKELM